MPKPDLFVKHIKDKLVPRIRQGGFRRGFPRFQRITDELVHEIDIQGCRYGGQRTINLSIGFTFVQSPSTTKHYPIEYSYRIGTSGGHDKWWRYSKLNLAECVTLADEMIAVFDREAPSFFARFDNFPDSFANIPQRKSQKNLMNEHDIDGHSELCTQISMIYGIHSLGGPLHIVLDDGNTDDDSIRFCLDTCRDHHTVTKRPKTAETLVRLVESVGHALLEMDESTRDILYGQRWGMNDAPQGHIDGYQMFVRTASGIVVFVCVLTCVFLYFFRVAVNQTYNAGSSNFEDLSLIGLLAALAISFSLSIYRGKFVWFLGGEN